jgi:hypothetical protein
MYSISSTSIIIEKKKNNKKNTEKSTASWNQQLKQLRTILLSNINLVSLSSVLINILIHWFRFLRIAAPTLIVLSTALKEINLVSELRKP